jgi:hypothetical protein
MIVGVCDALSTVIALPLFDNRSLLRLRCESGA